MDFISNEIIVASLISWSIAQILKVIINYIKYNKLNLERFVGTGGMPSAHSAFVMAATIATLRRCGAGSTEFAIILIFATVVMYDAMTLRRRAGLHAKRINEIEKKMSENEDKLPENKKLNELLGHTFLEVLCGAVLGVVVGILVPIEL